MSFVCLGFVRIFDRLVFRLMVDRKLRLVNHSVYTNGALVSHQVQKTSFGNREINFFERNFSFFHRKNIPMSEISHWFRIIVVNIVSFQPKSFTVTLFFE